ncbi:MAG: CehA/McbA family metallohydrolase [Chloroflexota bacterium]
MNNLPFDKAGQFWKGNIHTHSTNSDGRVSPEEACQRYRNAGYDFISLTDHFLENYGYPMSDTRAMRTDDFTTIIGAELHTGQTEMGSAWHILGVGLPLDFAPPTPDETGSQLAARALEAGAYVAIAHPHWYVLTHEDAISLGPDVHAVEVYNGISVDGNDRADSWHFTDILLGRGHRYTTCATDDCHFRPDYHDFGRGWVQVKSETLTPESILGALKAGHYYASTGPELYDIQVISGEKVIVRCSPANGIFMTGTASNARRVLGQGIIEAELELTNFDSPYCRITVRDMQGERAWSNPIWLDK